MGTVRAVAGDFDVDAVSKCFDTILLDRFGDASSNIEAALIIFRVLRLTVGGHSLDQPSDTSRVDRLPDRLKEPVLRAQKTSW